MVEDEKIGDLAAANDKRNFLSLSAGRVQQGLAVLLLAPLQLRKVELPDGWFGI